MLRQRDLESYRRAQDIYRHYAERERLLFFKSKLEKMIAQKEFKELFATEKAMEYQVNTFKKKKTISHRNLNIQSKILNFYKTL